MDFFSFMLLIEVNISQSTTTSINIDTPDDRTLSVGLKPRASCWACQAWSCLLDQVRGYDPMLLLISCCLLK